MIAEAQEKDQTYLVEKRKGKYNGLRFDLLRTNQSSSKKNSTIIFNHHGPISSPLILHIFGGNVK